jgi:hypothetical protein
MHEGKKEGKKGLNIWVNNIIFSFKSILRNALKF